MTIVVTARGSSNDDCSDGTTVELAEPLGDRKLIDGSSDEPIPIE